MTQRLDCTAIAPAGIKALGSVYGYIVQSGLPRPLVTLVYLRTSQINGCAYCIDMHSRDLIKEAAVTAKNAIGAKIKMTSLMASLTNCSQPLGKSLQQHGCTIASV